MKRYFVHKKNVDLELKFSTKEKWLLVIVPNMFHPKILIGFFQNHSTKVGTF